MSKQVKAAKPAQEQKTAKTAQSGSKTRAQKQTQYKRAPVRLWVKSKFLGFRRGREIQRPNQALLKIEGVNDTTATRHYLGKRVVYIYKAATAQQGSKFRTIWGRIAKPHGGKGVVVARFKPNLPARAMGATLRVMLYPSTI